MPRPLRCELNFPLPGSPHSLTELGKRLGPMSLAAGCNGRTKMAAGMRQDTELKKRIKKISISINSELNKVKLED